MPNVFLDYDTTPWCSLKNIDVEKYDNVCLEMAEKYSECGQCPYMELQAYRITVQNLDQKEFISPKQRSRL